MRIFRPAAIAANDPETYWDDYFGVPRAELFSHLVGWHPAYSQKSGDPACQHPPRTQGLMRTTHLYPDSGKTEWDYIKITEVINDDTASCRVMVDHMVAGPRDDYALPDKTFTITLYPASNRGKEKILPRFQFDNIKLEPEVGKKRRGFGRPISNSLFRLALSLGFDEMHIMDIQEIGPYMWGRLALDNVTWNEGLSTRVAAEAAHKDQSPDVRAILNRMNSEQDGNNIAELARLRHHGYAVGKNILLNCPLGNGVLSFRKQETVDALARYFGFDVDAETAAVKRPRRNARSLAPAFLPSQLVAE